MLEIETLAHEIINPLNVIVGCAELSKIIHQENSKKHKNNSNKNNNNKNNNSIQNNQIIEYLDTILSQSQQCCSILNKEIDNYKSRQFNPRDVSCLIKSCVQIKKKHPLYKQKQLTFIYQSVFKCNSLNDNLNFNLNMTYLKIILNNLLLNSIKYSKHNTSIIIKLDLDKKTNKLLITIQNNILMNKTQSSNLNKSNYIGLTLVDNLVNSLEGEWDMTQVDDTTILTSIIL